MSTATKLTMTADEYVAFERSATEKHELLNGEIVAMAGGTPAHALIGTNIAVQVGVRLRGRPCRVYSSDLSIHGEETGLYAYPDVTVICGPLRLDPKDGRSAVNPRVIFEVLSDSTEQHDRGPKAAHYRQIPSLAEYVFVAQLERRVEHWRRLETGQWLVTEHLGTGELVLPALDLALPLDEIYDGVDELRASASG